MPSSCTVTVLPAEPLNPAHDELHQLACHLLEAPRSADHDAARKPFAVWPLVPSPAHPQAVELRLNWLDGRRPLPLERVRHRLAVGARLGQVPLSPLAIRQEHRPLNWLRDQQPARAYDLDFVSPTYFARSGRDYPLPDPETLLRWLVRRWNNTAGEGSTVAITPAQAKAVGSRVVLTSALLETTTVRSASGTSVGFLGRIRLGLNKNGDGAPALLGALCAYAAYSGIGAQTTHGLGAVRVTPVHG